MFVSLGAIVETAATSFPPDLALRACMLLSLAHGRKEKRAKLQTPRQAISQQTASYSCKTRPETVDSEPHPGTFQGTRVPGSSSSSRNLGSCY